ncbi:glycosyltransferase family 2 protein [Saccharothrix australiensis]|uniref:4,4'-diaponeurosporenoate glycosyltransferase n=1 Tax=Saccharothrix australiensis TaxID=2072 RepID=A0A495VRJ1_9PSEU|nr:glycosyltransferase family A protein [Saccharothrix australiensis]RKT51999.1 glycosyl transferase family 2 [Saccharothrix australiensis]
MTSRSDVPSLSVVIPVFNEPDWIGRSVGALRTALANAEWDAEIVVVDDGSTDDTPERLAELPGVTVVTQPNGGRFAARFAGITRASGELVMLLDSRVLLEPGSLVFLRDQLLEHPERTVWNGHINSDDTGNPYGAFMQGLVAVGWRRYVANPRLTSFTAEEFDAFPKGTTLFVAPRKLLEEAATSFTSLYDDVRLASDDTRMLRWVSEQGPIFLAPDFAARYISRDSLPKFVKHAYFRGSTFVDGYLDSPGPVRNAAFAAGGVGLAGLVLLLRKPKAAVVLAAAGSAAAGAVVRRCGGSKAQSLAVAKLLTLFAACFGAGAARGLALALRKRLGR